MKRVLLASVGILALSAAAASAADIPRRVAPRPAPVVVSQAYNWTGGYVGLYGGYGWGSNGFTSPVSTGNFDLSGGVAGGTIGYNYQVNQAVFGLEGDFGWSGIKGSTNCGGLNCETRNHWLSTVRGRVGYAADRFMPYVTGGAAFGDIKADAGFGSETKTRTGWTVGGGLEAAIAGPWTAKVEYLYVDLGKGDCGTGVCGTPTNVDFKAHVVRAGINYRF